MTTELITTHRGRILIMTLSGPATRNALSPQVYAAGIETLNMAESNPEVAGVVLTGEGRHFCSGGDVQRLWHNRQHDLAQQGDNLEAFHQWIEALRSFPKPVIAAVEGTAAGGGVSLALACDLLVVADSARFVMAYGQLGLSPDGACTWHLARALGRGRALALLWEGQSHSAAQWHEWGLVHKLTGTGHALSEACDWAEHLAQVPANVLSSIKELVGEAGQPLSQHLQDEKRHFLQNLRSPEAGEAMAAFLQRKPKPL